MYYPYRDDLALQVKSLALLADPPEGKTREFMAHVIWEFAPDGLIRFGWRYEPQELALWLFRAGVWYLLAGVTSDQVAAVIAESESELPSDESAIGCGLLTETIYRWRRRQGHPG